MKLKKSIQDVQYQIQSQATSIAANSINYAFQQIYGYDSGGQQNQVNETMKNAIAKAIGLAVAESFRVLMENQYTDNDFEKDIGLTP